MHCRREEIHPRRPLHSATDRASPHWTSPSARPLEQIHRDILLRRDPLHRKVAATDERVHPSSVAGLTKSKAVAQIKPRQRANARVEHVFNQNILRVLA